MSVELSGPLGFEVQYLATVWLALLAENATPGAVSLRVEEKEDAEMTLTIGGEVLLLAMQSKYQQGDLDPETFAAWLAHFSPRNGAESLLGRMMEQPSQLALFITRARCTDDVSPLIRNHGNLKPHDKVPLVTSQIQILSAELSKVHDSGDTNLTKARKLECDRLASQLTDTHRDCLRRILIWEQVTGESITQAITQLLIGLRIPASETVKVIDALVRNVREARDTRGELMPGLRKVLVENRVARILDEPLHTLRAEEPDLLAELSTKHVVCLTGRAQSGKSHMGRALAQTFQDQGCKIFETDDLKAARSFLDPDDHATKVVLLDDPLLLAEKPLAVWEAIAKVAQSLPPQHRLIVTAKKEHLVQLKPDFRANVSDLFGLTWHDLTTSDRGFLKSYWTRLASKLQIPSTAVDGISSHINTAREVDLLQPGQLRHLAHRPPGDLSNQTNDGLLGIARFNAEQIASELLADEAIRRVALVLGVAGTAKTGMALCDIAFVLDEATHGQDLKDETLGRMMSFGSFLSDAPENLKFPTYSRQPILSADVNDQLRRIYRKGYISKPDTTGRVRFEHPDYREAFQRHALIATDYDSNQIVLNLERSFEALDESTGISAARLLDLWLPLIRQEVGDLYDRVVDLALRVIRNSIFPNVRTTAILPLLRELGHLNREQERSLMSLGSWSDHETRYVVWNGTVPWIHSSEDGWYHDLSRTRRMLPAEDLISVIARFKSIDAAGTVSGAEADALNTAFLAGDGPTPEPQLLRALLNREEVFIRADAASVAMAHASIMDSQIRELVFKDDHPIVVGRAVRSAFRHWELLTVDLQYEVERRVCDALGDPLVAALSRSFFDMGDEYGSHDVNWKRFDEHKKRAVWSFWARGVSAALRALAPRRYSLNSGRFFNSTRIAAGWLSQEDGLLFASAWMDWIDGQLAHSYLDDGCVALADFLLDVTRACPEERKVLSERLLGLRGSDALAQNMADYIDRWTELTDHERELIRQLLRSNREDVEWLRAIALTRAKPPTEITVLITNRQEFFDLPAPEQSSILPADLLAKCAQILTRHVGNGNQFGIPSAAEGTWRAILNLHLEQPASPLFLLAVSDHLNRSAWNALHDPALVAAWARTCANRDETTRHLLFRELLNLSLNYAGSQLDPLWEVFLSLPLEPAERRFYASEVAVNLEGLSTTQHSFEDLGKLLGREFLIRDVLPLSKGDYLFCRVCLPLMNRDDDAEALTTLVEVIYRTTPPRIHEFHLMIQNRLKASRTTDQSGILSRVEEVRRAGIDSGSEQGRRRRPFEPDRPHWIHPEWR